MKKNRLSILLYASPSCVRDISCAGQYDQLFAAISETYLPLLSMLSRLEEDSVPCRLSLVLPPVLCTLLHDPRIQKLYLDYTDRRIALGESELKRLSGDSTLLPLAGRCLDKARKDKADFSETYGQNLLDAFRSFAKKGMVELVPTAATGAFLPHCADMTELLNAQIETGLYAQRQFFGDSGDGFFLPYMGYATGLDSKLKSYGVGYTVLDARSVLFSKDDTPSGIFAPVRTRASLAVLAADPGCPGILDGEGGLRRNAVYRSQQSDIGFDLDAGSLSAFLGQDERRVQTLYKYWANGSTDCRIPYDADAALLRAKEDASLFVMRKQELLSDARKCWPGDSRSVPSLVCAVPMELMGQDWAEGTDWLEQVVRMTAASPVMELALCRELVQDAVMLPRITPYPCASAGAGYGENFLDSSNSWMIRYVRKAGERMVDLSERFPSESGLKMRLLNIAAREVLMAQSAEWPRMISEGVMPDEAAAAFSSHILAFTTVFDCLASNTVSTEWLTRTERDHAVFPWMNYRIFSRKK